MEVMPPLSSGAPMIAWFRSVQGRPKLSTQLVIGKYPGLLRSPGVVVPAANVVTSSSLPGRVGLKFNVRDCGNVPQVAVAATIVQLTSGVCADATCRTPPPLVRKMQRWPLPPAQTGTRDEEKFSLTRDVPVSAGCAGEGFRMWNSPQCS